MIPVRQSTAFEFSIGPVLDADGVAVTDCVAGDFKIKKTTGNFAALNGSATVTHVSAGTYDVVLTTSDLDTVGLATVAIDDTVNACAPVRMQVLEEVVYDALYAASANTFTGAAGSTKVTGVVLVDTTTTNTDMRGTDSASTHSAADVWAVGTRELTAFSASFKTGYALSSAGVQAIWDALTSALTTVGSIGKLLVDNINATISSRSSHAATDIVSGGAITTSGGAVSTVTTTTTATNLTNAPTNGDLTATMKTSVNAEVLDVLNTDTFAEPGQGAPAATASLVAKIGYLYKNFRNRKTQTSTVWSLYNDDATTVDHKATVADDGTTASKTEVASGP